jgi:hypothetical protein
LCWRRGAGAGSWTLDRWFARPGTFVKSNILRVASFVSQSLQRDAPVSAMNGTGSSVPVFEGYLHPLSYGSRYGWVCVSVPRGNRIPGAATMGLTTQGDAFARHSGPGKRGLRRYIAELPQLHTHPVPR